MPAKTIWLVVADAARAHIFEVQREERRLDPVEELESTTARRKTSDLVSDRQGRAFPSSGAGPRSAMEPHTDPQRHEQEEFARHVANELDRAAEARRFDGIWIVAAPRALGALRPHLSREVQQRVVGELDMDLAHLTVPQLLDHLPGELWR